MKLVYVSLIALLLPLSHLQASAPIITGYTPEGSPADVSVQVETIPIATTTRSGNQYFAEIMIDVAAARQHLADKIATSTSDVTVPTVATSASELEEYANFLAGAHPAITNLVITTQDIQLGYQLPATALFVIPVHYTATAVIDQQGHLQKFSTPWWLSLVHDQAGATRVAVDTALEKLVTALAESTNEPPTIFLLKQKQLSVAIAALKTSAQ